MAHINSALVAVSKEPNPTRFQKTLGVNDFYHGSDDFDFPLGHIQMLGKSDREVIKEGAPVPTPGLRARLHREPRGRLLAHLRGSAAIPTTASPSTATGASTSPTPTRNYEGHRRLIAKLKGLLTHIGCHPTADPEPADPRRAHPARRRGAPVRHGALRRRPGDLGARRQLQGARPRQPVRRRHELLPVLDAR